MSGWIWGALFVLLAWSIISWIRDVNRFVIVEYTIPSAKMKKPYSFVLLSDLHNKQYGKNNRKLAEAVLAQKADSVIIAGDMYTSKEGTGYENALSLLEQLKDRVPVYYANGNHEQKTAMYPETYGYVYREFCKELKCLGIRHMINSHVNIPAHGISLCGSQIGKEYYKHFTRKEFPKGYLEQLIGKADQNAFQILIAHNPDYFREYADWGADLVLSGHVHGGVIRLPGLGGVISPAFRLFPHYDGGIFRDRQASMVLSRGLGMHTIPVRIFNPGELVVVHLKPEE